MRRPFLASLAVGQLPVQLRVTGGGVGQRRRQRASGGHGLRLGDDGVAVDDRHRDLVQLLLPVRGRPDEDGGREQRQQQSHSQDARPSATAYGSVLAHGCDLDPFSPGVACPAVPTSTGPAPSSDSQVGLVLEQDHGHSSARQLVSEYVGTAALLVGQLVDPEEHDDLGAAHEGQRRLEDGGLERHVRRDRRGQLAEQAECLVGVRPASPRREAQQPRSLAHLLLDAGRGRRPGQVDQGRGPVDRLALLGQQPPPDDQLAAERPLPARQRQAQLAPVDVRRDAQPGHRGGRGRHLHRASSPSWSTRSRAIRAAWPWSASQASNSTLRCRAAPSTSTSGR